LYNHISILGMDVKWPKQFSNEPRKRSWSVI